MNQDNRVTVPIRGRMGAMLFDRNVHPSLVIHYDGLEFELIVGDHEDAAEDGYQFGMGLAYAALTFATRCRYLTELPRGRLEQ